MSVAYSSKVLSFPLSDFCGLFQMEDEGAAAKACSEVGVRVEGGKIKFSKVTFIQDNKVRILHKSSVD